MGCEVILPKIGTRGKITEHYFSKLGLNINRLKICFCTLLGSRSSECQNKTAETRALKIYISCIHQAGHFWGSCLSHFDYFWHSRFGTRIQPTLLRCHIHNLINFFTMKMSPIDGHVFTSMD